MNVLILNPPHPTPIIREGRCQSPQDMRKNSIPQMTLAYLAGMLEREGRQVLALDCIALDMGVEDLFVRLEGFHPRVALVNTTTPSIRNDMLFVEEFGRRFPDCFLAVFGTHVTALHEQVLSANPRIDAVIRGEPEWVAVALAREVEKAGRPESPLPGCSHRDKEGQPVIGPDNEFPGDLDSLAYPAWGQFPLERYLHPVFEKPYVMVNTSRGCVHNCIFCVAHQFYGKTVRFRSVESIIEEIRTHVQGRFGIRHVWLYADDFTRDAAFVKRLCQAIIDARLNIVWWSNTRVDNRDEEMFKLMRQSGCYMLSIGGESGCPEILKRMKKATKPEFIRDTVDILRRVGIKSLVYFLIGLPGETRETIDQTVDFAKAINPDYVEFYPAIPYPGTEFYRIAAAEQLIAVSEWDTYFCGGGHFVVNIPGVGREELDGILRRAYRSFYLRPAYMLILLKRMLHPMEFYRLMKFGFGYFLRFFK